MAEQTFDGAKVALFIGDKLLIILRDDDPSIPYPNLWDVPGGGREDGETADETLMREVMEEVGLTLPKEALLWRRLYDADFYPGAKVWFYVARMPADTENDIVFGDEGQGWKLVSLQEFRNLENVVHTYAGRLADWEAATGGLK